MEKWASGGGVGVGSVLFQEGVVSLMDCAARCVSMPSCRALATAPGSPPSLTCRGYGYPAIPTTTTTNMTSTTPATTTTTSYSGVADPWRVVWILDRSDWLRKGCHSGADCGGEPLVECVHGSCLCSPGYYYSLSHDACVQSCASEHLLHTKFLAYPGWRIEDHNIGSCLKIGEEECLALCASTEQAVTCDFLTKYRILCCPQDATKLDIESSEWVEDVIGVHYQKMCI